MAQLSIRGAKARFRPNTDPISAEFRQISTHFRQFLGKIQPEGEKFIYLGEVGSVTKTLMSEQGRGDIAPVSNRVDIIRINRPILNA